MPLIDVTLKHDYWLHTKDDGLVPPHSTRDFVRKNFAPALPKFFVDHAKDFGMDPDTPADGIQVQNHDYDSDDINIAQIRVKVQFSADMPEEPERFRICDSIFNALTELFVEAGFLVPNDFVVDVFWGPTNGRGCVNGTPFEW